MPKTYPKCILLNNKAIFYKLNSLKHIQKSLAGETYTILFFFLNIYKMCPTNIQKPPFSITKPLYVDPEYSKDKNERDNTKYQVRMETRAQQTLKLEQVKDFSF